MGGTCWFCLCVIKDDDDRSMMCLLRLVTAGGRKAVAAASFPSSAVLYVGPSAGDFVEHIERLFPNIPSNVGGICSTN